MSPRLATTRLVKVPGGRRWKAVPAYVERPATAKEIAELFHAAEHELARAADPAATFAQRTRAASEASVKLAAVVLRASGYETVPAGDPQGTLEALPALFGADGREPASKFLACHRKDRGGRARRTAERNLEGLFLEVGKFRKAVVEWLETTRRSLVPRSPAPSDGDEYRQQTLF